MNAFPPFRVVLDDISVKYAQEWVLRTIRGTLSGGTLVGISGASGSGKSTLLRILACLQQPQQGTLTYYRDDQPDTHPLVADQAILALHKPVIWEHLSVMDNCMLPLLAQGLPADTLTDRVLRALHAVELSHTAHQLAHTLSGGQQQRIGWVRAALLECPVICLDEPTAHVDAATARLCIPLFRPLVQAGALVVIATHDPVLLSQCDVVYHIDQGSWCHA